MTANTRWYKNKKKSDEEEGVRKTGNGGDVRKQKSTTHLRTRAVMFIDQTPQGELARRVRDQLQKLEMTLGFRIKVMEKTGRSLQGIFNQTQLWQGLQCGE